jgi:uncharacterized protein YjbJ (UPF0337 family)
MNEDEMKGKFDQVKGAVKEQAGKALDNPDLEAEGDVDQAAGKIQEKAGTVRRKIDEKLDRI